MQRTLFATDFLKYRKYTAIPKISKKNDFIEWFGPLVIYLISI